MYKYILLLSALLSACNAEKATENADIQNLQLEIANLRKDLEAAQKKINESEKGVIDPHALSKEEVEFIQKLRAVVKFNNDSDIVFEGVNLLLRNGNGATESDVNGKGNLIIGYNEAPEGREVKRNGSHNLIVGPEHNYSSFGSVVFGKENSANADYASILGGIENQISGEMAATIVGGQNNTATRSGTVVGGYKNVSNGMGAIVLGGTENQAREQFSIVLGGVGSTSSGNNSISPSPTSNCLGSNFTLTTCQ